MTTDALLWFDDSAKPLAEKVEAAAAWHARKFGVRPNRCQVHPSELDGKDVSVDGIHVTAAHNVLRHHFRLWWENVENTVHQDVAARG